MTVKKQLKTNITHSISFKLGVIFLLMLIIQLPLSYVSDLIGQRQGLQRQAHTQIAQRWGGHQYIGAPFLSVETQREKLVKNQSMNHVSVTEKIHKFHNTNTLNADITLNAEKRYLGIYETAVYQSQIKLVGGIDIQKIRDVGGQWSLFVPIKQLKGLKRLNQITINGQIIDHDPSQKTYKNMSGFEIDVSQFKGQESLDYAIDLVVIGTQQFEVLPLAKETLVTMQSNWPSPSFIGDYLPDERTINDRGFTAQWQVNRMLQHLPDHNASSDGQLSYTHHNTGISDYGLFGVKVVITANVYQVNERSIKYSFLIVFLTFAAFFLAELFFQLRLHPFHYLIIGGALSVFYLLLLSVSEFLHFNAAFSIAASATTVMIGAYCSVLLKQRKRGLLTAAFFALLYGFIFVLVKAEQTSLLMGSIAIWLILALVMYMTRKIDWYAINVQSVGSKNAVDDNNT